ncbi:MAG: PucR family transcriptional regulator [Ruminococcaceae bacterium]|nr:PucR family transcriptional regulator [Oscillospiraceae bacterium]
MSNRLFQTVIHQMKDVLGRTIGVIDENGIIIACSELSKIGESRQRIREEMAFSQGTISYEGYHYRYITSSGKNDCIAFSEGNDSEAESATQLLAITLGNIKSLYDEKYDKGSFIKNIILDNILPSDIYIKSNELHFNSEEFRAVLVIKFHGSTDLPPYEIIQSIVEEGNKDYIISISEQDIVVVKEVERKEDGDALEAFAKRIHKTVREEHGVKVLIGVSSIVENLKDLARAYKEARVSLEVGKVFDIEQPVMSYENLGIGRLIYQLPTTLCEIFLQEVFKKGSLESLDKETLMTVQSFFENNLNVSETSRKLFVHRNTLVYRLEKIRKLTGLDLREFDHAVTFKVALMVKKYLTSKPTKF